MAQDRETRWIILAVDGRHVSLGRYADPSPNEIVDAEAGLARQGTAGWLVIMRGDYYARGKLDFVQARSLANPATPWDEALGRFEARRTAALSAS